MSCRIVVENNRLDIKGEFRKDDYNQELHVRLYNTNIWYDFSKYTNICLTLRKTSYCCSRDKQMELDLDHEFLPRQYTALSLNDCTLVGEFKRKITVRYDLTIENVCVPNSDAYRDYFTFVRRLHVFNYTLAFIPNQTRYIVDGRRVSPKEFGTFVKNIPGLRGMSMEICSVREANDLLELVRLNIHRLDPQIIYNLVVYDDGDEVDKICGQIMFWFTYLHLLKYFFMLDKKYPGIFFPLTRMIHGGYIGEYSMCFNQEMF